MTALHNLKFITDGVITSGKAVLISGETIIGIVDDTAIPAGADKHNLQGAYLAPGFIDLQIYGAGGKLFGGIPEVDALKRMEDVLLSEGTVGFFATIATNSDEVVERGIAAAKEYRDSARGNFWGLHLEGPYLNAAKKGAHPEQYIKKATLSELKRWIESADGVIKMMTIAPELQDQEVIDYLYAQGIIISSGHSNATYAQGKGFLNKPIPAVTHLFNAMPQMHHREPGYIPAIFEERPYASIVADGNHVDWAMIRLAKRELGDKLFLITDAVTEANAGAYQHRLEGNKYVMPDGTLSGSSLTMLKAVQNCVEKVGIELAEAVNMAAKYPAELAKMDKLGRIAAGYQADLIVFNDGYEVQATMLKGNFLTETI
ncbi:N-acetylglucosamine-6-phosphate deacetylase [Mucilaginibacter pedocola]|uniref:N-acetylglucosamine-6-phosphate deacetylase n=1 Tax=Mucilaginibacter pedocola TaxID=1792845 RepID=A0A1S9PE18_9SPHI|nr:N-acetylglucosamine-6-phosphate deacetylase [Mucilaginibacter pedocola]